MQPTDASGAAPPPEVASREIRLDFDPFAEPDEGGQRPLAAGFGNYAAWRRARGLELIDAQLHAERLSRWRQRPRFLMVSIADQQQTPLLARTLDSLEQQLYPDWSLLIVSDQPSPSPLFGSTPVLQWLTLPDVSDADALVALLNGLCASASHDWLGLFPAGFQLEPNALLALGDHIDQHPGRVVVYSDDDCVDDTGTHDRPRLKPDFDIDFLRGSDYVSPSAWFKSEAVEALGGLAPLGAASAFEFLLRVWEAVGDDGIGHLAQPLLHLPARAAEPVSDSPLHDAALIAHFERLRLPARVAPGLHPGTRRIAWDWSGPAPTVTIVIPTRDKLEFLAPCVERILERTRYDAYDILIVNNASSDPDLPLWLSSTALAHPGRLRMVDFAGAFDFAAINNFAATESDAEFLCLLNNDTEVIQDDWLARLVELARRPDVGAVGARLVYPETGDLQHAGYVLGMGLDGVAATPFARLCGIREPGPLDCLQVVRGCAAVSAVCLLIRRADYLALGGMDSPELALTLADIDLCLRLRAAGRRILWTPFATLVHYEGMSFNLRGLSPLQRGQWLEQMRKERATLLARWLPQMASNPFHNRNLSLVEIDYRLDSGLRPPWNSDFRERIRVLGIPLLGGSGTYRVKEPFDAIADAGRMLTMYPIEQTRKRPLPTLPELARLAPDVVLVHARVDDQCLDFLEQNRRFKPQMLQVFGLDDLMTQIPRKSKVWRAFHANFRDVRPRLRAALRNCDRLIVSTDPLAELCKAMIDAIVVVPNRLSAVWLGHTSRRNRGPKPRVGWVGAMQHQGDLELVEPVIEALAGEVDFVFMGMATERIRRHLAEFHQPVNWVDYPATMAALDLDIALAPLEQLPFNEAKSNLRLLEYGIFGWPVVCTDIYPYRHDAAPVTRVANEPDAWIAAIRALAGDPSRRAAEGDALQAWVRRGYLLEDHLDEWERALAP